MNLERYWKKQLYLALLVYNSRVHINRSPFDDYFDKGFNIICEITERLENKYKLKFEVK